MRGAEAGAQIRSGGLIEGNVFIANDTAFNVGIGNGDPSLVRNNLVTLAGYHDVRDYGGALAWGIDGAGRALVRRQHRRAPHRSDGFGRARHPRSMPASRSRTS